MEIQWMSATIIAVHSIMIHWNMTVHIIILSLDNLTLYNLVNYQKQSARQSQLKMLASVLRYTFRETQYTNISTGVQYITTLKDITVQEENNWNNKTIWRCVNLTLCVFCLWNTHNLYIFYMMTYVNIFFMNLVWVQVCFCIQSVSAFLWDAHAVSFVHFHMITNVIEYKNLCLAVHVNIVWKVCAWMCILWKHVYPDMK